MSKLGPAHGNPAGPQPPRGDTQPSTGGGHREVPPVMADPDHRPSRDNVPADVLAGALGRRQAATGEDSQHRCPRSEQGEGEPDLDR
jgi:hypothetical protein